MADAKNNPEYLSVASDEMLAELSEEETMKQGVDRPPNQEEVDSEDEQTKAGDLIVDDSSFSPHRVFYIRRFNRFSSEIEIVDLTDKGIKNAYSSGPIAEEFRDEARKLSDEGKSFVPLYKFSKPHWWNKSLAMTQNLADSNGKITSSEIATWKHPALSGGTATFSFPADSPHSTHEIEVGPHNRLRRTNYWVQDSVTYHWGHDGKLKSNRLALYKTVGNHQTIVARYAQRWGDFVAGGVLLVDDKQIDEVVAIMTATMMLKRMLQRAGERVGRSAGAGGGS